MRSPDPGGACANQTKHLPKSLLTIVQYVVSSQALNRVQKYELHTVLNNEVVLFSFPDSVA